MISVVSWFLYSYGLFLLFKFLDNNFHMYFLNFNSISVFSNLLGSFVIFMPAGIGVLETAFINLINDLTKLIFFDCFSIISFTNCIKFCTINLNFKYD